MKQTLSSVYRYQFTSDCKIDPKLRQFSVRAKVRTFTGAATWYFAMLPVNTSKEIRGRFGHSARGWGSLPVEVTLGESVWKTSIFPDKRAGAYLLPMKAGIRKKEGVRKGDVILFQLNIRT